MAIDGASPRTRRAMLTAALGAGAATVVAALGRPLAAQAADGENAIIGVQNDATSTTAFVNATTGQHAIRGSAAGVAAGIFGTSDIGPGVRGDSESDAGVVGFGNLGVYGGGGQRGVFGVTNGDFGTVGWSQVDTTGLLGYSGPADPWPSGLAKTGVYGVCKTDADSRGVVGESTSGQGVRGIATTGQGVRGEATTGTGVVATATTGWALRTVGKVKLDKSAGLATIPSGGVSVAVTPGIDLTGTSAVIATLQTNAGGATTVKRVAVNAATNQFTIYLTANSTASVKVAWLVLG